MEIEDAMFSLGVDDKIIQGLDAMIEYYRRGSRTGLQHALTEHVPGATAPPESRLIVSSISFHIYFWHVSSLWLR